MIKNKNVLLTIAASLLLATTIKAEKKTMSLSELSGQTNVVSTAVSFLTIAPDSRSGGMGEVGAGTSSDVWSMHWNPSKFAFGEKDLSVGLSYTPWLRHLGINNMYIAYLAGYKKLDKEQTVAASIKYFSIGDVNFTDDNNQPLGTYSPHEYSIDVAYSRLLSENFSLGIAGRYIYTNLLGNYVNDSKPGRSVAADISGYYKDKVKNGTLTLGFDISNIGAQISYSTNGEKSFIPTNLRIGGGYLADIDAHNQIGIYADLNKLLVPTPSKEIGDTTYGRDDNVSVTQGIFQSFNDAPGGFKEEMHEIQISGGLEYWYAQQFALRGGYFHEHETKGNRKYFTLGIGLRLSAFQLDVAYLVPTQGKSSALANTLRFSLTFDFDGLKAEESSLE